MYMHKQFMSNLLRINVNKLKKKTYIIWVCKQDNPYPIAWSIRTHPQVLTQTPYANLCLLEKLQMWLSKIPVFWLFGSYYVFIYI